MTDLERRALLGDRQAHEECTSERAVELLASLKRGWFPYSMPCWSEKVTSSDLENYEICCAIDKTIERLTEGDKEK